MGKLKWNRTPNKLWEMKQIQIGYCTIETGPICIAKTNKQVAKCG